MVLISTIKEYLIQQLNLSNGVRFVKSDLENRKILETLLDGNKSVKGKLSKMWKTLLQMEKRRDSEFGKDSWISNF